VAGRHAGVGSGARPPKQGMLAAFFCAVLDPAPTGIERSCERRHRRDPLGRDYSWPSAYAVPGTADLEAGSWSPPIAAPALFVLDRMRTFEIGAPPAYCYSA